MTPQEYITKYNLAMTVVQVPDNPHSCMDDAYHWCCQIGLLVVPGMPLTKAKEWKYTMYYSKGLAHVGYLRRELMPVGGSLPTGEKKWIRATPKQLKEEKWGGYFGTKAKPIPAQLTEVIECLAMDFSSVEGGRVSIPGPVSLVMILIAARRLKSTLLSCLRSKNFVSSRYRGKPLPTC